MGSHGSRKASWRWLSRRGGGLLPPLFTITEIRAWCRSSHRTHKRACGSSPPVRQEGVLLAGGGMAGADQPARPTSFAGCDRAQPGHPPAAACGGPTDCWRGW
jgi:hypothetical protein